MMYSDTCIKMHKLTSIFFVKHTYAGPKELTKYTVSTTLYYHIAGIFRGGKYSFFHQQIDFRALYFCFCFISTIL